MLAEKRRQRVRLGRPRTRLPSEVVERIEEERNGSARSLPSLRG